MGLPLGGPVILPSTTVPTAAPDTYITLFSKRMAGRDMLAFIGAAGESSVLQPHLGGKSICRWNGMANATTGTTDGMSITATGTATSASLATTNLFNAARRIEHLVTTAATTAVAGWRGAQVALWRGNAARLGGFFVRLTAGPATGVTNTTDRFFMGLTSSTSAPTDVNPSSLLNIIGIGWDAGDSTVQFMYNDGTSTATKVSLATLTKAAADRTAVYELILYTPSNSSTIYYEVTDVTNNVSVTGSINTDIPSNTTFLLPAVYASVGGTSSVTGVAVMNYYSEADQ